MVARSFIDALSEQGELANYYRLRFRGAAGSAKRTAGWIARLRTAHSQVSPGFFTSFNWKIILA
jgi:hypothetical protein